MAAVLFQPRSFLRAAVELLDGLASGDSVLLGGLSWEEYVWFDQQRTERRPNIFLAYHDGKLGFAANAFLHENRCGRLKSLVLAVAVACSLKLAGAGRTTFRRDDLRLCVQADASYSIAHWVEDPRSPLPKLPIHAALGVPEVWVIDCNGATFYWLGSRGEYELRTVSRSRPMVNAADVSQLILDDEPDDTRFGERAYAWAETLTQ